MGTRKKLLLVCGGIVLIALVAGATVLFVRSRDDSKGTRKLSDAEMAENLKIPTERTLPPSISQYEEIQAAYSDKKYADVIKLTRAYEKTDAADVHKRLALSECLDAAIQINDSDAKEFCYKKARALAQADKDDVVKNGLTKTLDDMYQGKQAGGTTVDGGSQ